MVQRSKMIDIKEIVDSPDFASLMDTTIDPYALDKMVEDAAVVMSVNKETKLAFLLFVLGSAEEVLTELKSVHFLRLV